MKKNKMLVIAILLVVLLAITTASQISSKQELWKISQITSKISIEEKEICETTNYEVTKILYGNCISYSNYTSCLNTSGANTDCVPRTDILTYQCALGNQLVQKNKTQCKLDDSSQRLVIDIRDGANTVKKEIDFSNWVCVKSTENYCLAITCGTLQGGSARNGIFNGCDGGKSCQKFLFCDNEIKVLYKASRDDFVEQDPTFQLSKLTYKEVGQ